MQSDEIFSLLKCISNDGNQFLGFKFETFPGILYNRKTNNLINTWGIAGKRRTGRRADP
jgi:hypothetical protein